MCVTVSFNPSVVFKDAGAGAASMLLQSGHPLCNIFSCMPASNDLCLCHCQDLQVMKVKRPGVGVICFVAKLNRSSAALPQAVLNAPGTVSIGRV